MAKHIQAVIFDLDDTLYCERDYVRSGYSAVAEYLRETLNRPEQFQDWLWERFLTGESANALDAMNEHFSLGLDGDRISRLVEVYRSHRPAIRPRKGVAALLASLGRKYKLGLLSDGFMPAQRLKLDAIGMEEFLDGVVFTEELGRHAWKPSPAGFEEIRRLLDVPHAGCAYIGDNLSKDFVAPNQLGWLSIQLLMDDQVHSAKPIPPGGQPQIIVHSLDDIPDALQNA